MRKQTLKMLVLGGARSGKSAFAEDVAERLSDRRIYVATGEARDKEMAERIRLHKARRGEGWETLEAPLDPVSALQGSDTDGAVLIDCLTLWLSNHFEAGSDIDAATEGMVADLRQLDRPVVLVSNEIGLGLVPETSLGRSFRDAQGLLNQRMAEAVDVVVFVAAGLPMALKGQLP